MKANAALARSHKTVHELLADLFRGNLSVFHSSAALLV